MTTPTTAPLRHGQTVLRVVRAVEDATQPADLPWNAELAAAYGTRDALLVALHDHWSRHLLSHLDAALEFGAETPDASVAMAWRSALRGYAGVHRLLERERDNPALRASRRSLFASVAVAAGLATFDDPASVSAAAGERFLATLDETADTAPRPPWLARALRRLWSGSPAPDPYPWSA